MQTVNFQCGHCGNLMAVGEESLGQQVRCPHCEEVVLAPAPTPSVPTEPPPPVVLQPAAPESPPVEHLPVFALKRVESIFDPPEQGDDLFDEGLSPNVVIPPVPVPEQPVPTPTQTPVAAQLSAEPPRAEENPSPSTPPSPTAQPPVPEGPLDTMVATTPPVSMEFAVDIAPGTTAALAFAGTSGVESLVSRPAAELTAPPEPAPGPSPEVTALPPPESAPLQAVPSSPAPAPNASAWPLDTGLEPLAAPGAEAFPAPRPSVRAQQASAGSWFMALVFIPLISYSILATILVVILYLRLQAPQKSPLEELPDLEGDFVGAKRQKQSAITYERIAPEQALPRHLRVALGQALRIGDLEVTPEKVELRAIRLRLPPHQPEPGKHDALVLHLRLKNVSGDLVFSPTDPFFERRWKKGQAWSMRPYTYLEVGKERLYGGPVPWRAGARTRETVEGQTHKLLQPGEVLETLICTDPDDDRVARLVSKHPGTLLWRVQVRRGLVPVKNRDVPATAVLGVEFTASDVRRQKA